MNKQNSKIPHKPLRMIPCGILMVLAILSLTYVFLPHTPMVMGWAIPLMVGIGAGVGAVYFYTLKRPTLVYTWVFVGFAFLIASAGGGYFMTEKIDFNVLAGCEVCGLKTLESSGTTCPVCQVTLDSAHQFSEGYNSKEEFVKGEQFIYFFPDKLGDTVDFYDHYQGPRPYQHTSSWIPKIDASEISEMYTLMGELGN